MFKTSQLLLLGLVALIFLLVVFRPREHMSMNKDNSKNWDKPELSSVPAPVPENQELKLMHDRLTALESAVSDLKTKVQK
jgi:hypothetical protein